MPIVGSDDVFEEVYLDKLKMILSSKGLKVEYPKDRAALDGGLHLYTGPGSGSRTVSQTRVWFQAKGKRTATLSQAEYANASNVEVSVSVDHVRFWYASPEPVYLIVYIEAADRFIAEDVRDIVDRQWPSFYQNIASTQKTVTLHVQASAIFDESLVSGMIRHKSMRIDGPAFRGRPLGHRFDPLRSEMKPPSPALFEQLVASIQAAHGFRAKVSHVPPSVSARVASLQIVGGVFHQTLEWQWPLGTAFGIGDDPAAPQTEAPIDFVHGDCLVIVDSSSNSSRYSPAESAALTAFVRSIGARCVLIFVNADEHAGLALWRGALVDLIDPKEGHEFWPISLGALSQMVLAAPLIYLEFAPSISWRFLNYL